MKILLSDEQRATVDRARTFAAERLRPRAAEFNQTGVPRELALELGQAGFLGALIDEQWGGRPLDPVVWGLVTEEIGKVCCNTRYLLTVHASIVAGTLARLGSKAQKSRWLPAMAQGETIAAFALSEPEVGSDAASVRTRYEKRADGYVLSGRKCWTSFGALADVFLVIARDGDKATAFLVERDRPNVHVKPMRDLMTARGSHVAEIHLDGVEVPADNVVCRPGAGFIFVVSTALDLGRYSVAWGGVGVAQGALEAMTSHAATREQFGQPIHEFQLVKALIADAVVNTHAARALCVHAGELRRAGDPDAIIETTIAKQFAARVATKVTGDALQVHGARGFLRGNPVERLVHEARVLEIIEGSTQIQQIMIGDHGVQAYARDSS